MGKVHSVGEMKEKWDDHAAQYDEWYQTFEGAVEHYVDCELLKGYLPQNRDAKILDAAGGTGRITLPLAKMGYSVTLCDISPGMLQVAEQKLWKEGVLEKVEISECDVRKLRFPDESFDFVIHWDGGIEGAKELIRVARKGGKISFFLMNRCNAALSMFHRDPEAALAMLRSESNYVSHGEERHRVISEGEAREFFVKEGVKIIEIYAVCGMLKLLSIPEEVRESRKWDKGFFEQVTEMVVRLSRDSSVRGLSRHLVLYGVRI